MDTKTSNLKKDIIVSLITIAITLLIAIAVVPPV